MLEFGDSEGAEMEELESESGGGERFENLGGFGGGEG